MASPQLPASSIIEEVACPFPDTRSIAVTCGFLRREFMDSQGKVFFAVLRNRRLSDRPGQAVLVIPGGPGVSGSSGENTVPYWGDFLLRLSPNLDMVIFDPLGTGFSESQLDCDALIGNSTLEWMTNATLEEESAELFNIVQDCIVKARSAGISVAAFSTAATASATSVLMDQLKYESWVVHAFSYGTRVAQQLDTSVRIDAVVLDSFEPSTRNALRDVVYANTRAFDTLSYYCEQDARCSSSYADLRRKLILLGRSLDEEPMEMGTSESPIVVNGHRLFAVLYHAMSRFTTLELLPWTVESAYRGNYEPLRGLIETSLTSDSEQSASEVVAGWAVDCNDHSHRYFSETSDTEEFSGAAFSVSRLKVLCEEVVGSAEAVQDSTAYKPVPTLVLSGEFDVITPAVWARDWVSANQHIGWLVFRRTGHSVVNNSDCAFQAARIFIANPLDWNPPECVTVETLELARVQ